MSSYNDKDIKEVLLYIKNIYGKEVFSEPNRLIALVSDYAPSLKNERRMLQQIAHAGILQKLLTADDETEVFKKQIIFQSIQKLIKENYIQEDIAKQYIGVLVTVFGWTFKEKRVEKTRNTSYGNVNTQSSSTKNSNPVKYPAQQATSMGNTNKTGSTTTTVKMKNTRLAQNKNLSYQNKTNKSSKVFLIALLAVIICVGAIANGNSMIQKSIHSRDVSSSGISVGDTIDFGHYHKYDDGQKMSHNIEWKVLAVEGNKGLLLSKYIIDARKMTNEQVSGVGWKDTDLRSWLNSEFLNLAFSEYEQEKILQTTVVPDKNLFQKIKEEETSDKVFLLSKKELKKYLNKKDAKGIATRYAAEKVLWLQSDESADWWLRNHAGNVVAYATVSSRGTSGFSQHCAGSFELGIRPAMWIDLENF